MQKFIFLLLFLVTQSWLAYGQLSFRNEHDRPVQLALAYMVKDADSPDGKKWISEGWFAVEAGGTALLKEKVAERYYYLYIIDDKNNEWGGDGFSLLVDVVNEFTIKKADKTYISEANKTYKFQNFMEIDTGNAGNTREFTYVFYGKKNDVSQKDN